jgi:hypothetical protein
MRSLRPRLASTPPEPACARGSRTAAAAAECGGPRHVADAIRAEAAEVAQVCAQAARLGVTIDAADAVAKGVKPEALRARVLADLAARSDAAGIIATAPAAGAKESPIVAAAKKSRRRQALNQPRSGPPSPNMETDPCPS